MYPRRVLPLIVLLSLIGVIVQARAAEITLFDWAINLDGTLTVPPAAVFGAVDASGFQFVTGLGSLIVTVVGGGPHFIGVFLDHEIDETQNTFFNEFGATQGALASGQSWEIDEPFLFGDIAQNIAAGLLDNHNDVPATAPNDVAMALGWNFLLASDQMARLQFVVSDQRPTSGFVLSQTDPDSPMTLYFTSTLDIQNGPVQTVPEPHTVILLSSGLLALLAGRPIWRLLATRG